jgi:hypothetical protein
MRLPFKAGPKLATLGRTGRKRMAPNTARRAHRSGEAMTYAQERNSGMRRAVGGGAVITASMSGRSSGAQGRPAPRSSGGRQGSMR